MSTPIQNRYDFVYIFDVTDGNPNGDPDAGNLPRIDAETGQGLVTDVCLKRKVRNFVAEAKGSDKGHRIFIKEGAVLNQQIEEAYSQSDQVKKALIEWTAYQKNKKLARPAKHFDDVARDWMCENFFDVRTFGAVMTTGDEKTVEEIKAKIKMTAGQVRGPIQLTISRSIDRIVSNEFAITRCAVTNEKDEQKERTIGRKFAVPYGLYVGYGYINASLAAQTGFSDDDLALFKSALNMMFENDRSAARGRMSPVKCVAFRHESKLGNARADQLFARVSVARKNPADKAPPRSKDDYVITVDELNMPSGVTVENWV